MANDIYVHIGQQIKELRRQYGSEGLSQEQLAKAIKVTPNTISRWENAEYKPKIEDLEKLASFFKVQISSFLPAAHQPENPEINSLLSATADLKKEDIKILTEFALFRKTRKVLSDLKK